MAKPVSPLRGSDTTRYADPQLRCGLRYVVPCGTLIRKVIDDARLYKSLAGRIELRAENAPPLRKLRLDQHSVGELHSINGQVRANIQR